MYANMMLFGSFVAMQPLTSRRSSFDAMPAERYRHLTEASHTIETLYHIFVRHLLLRVDAIVTTWAA